MVRSVVVLGLLVLGASVSAGYAADDKARLDVLANRSPEAAVGLAAAVKDESGKFAGSLAVSAAKVTLSDSARAAAIADQPSIKVGSQALSANADAGSNKLDVIAVRADAKMLDGGSSIGAADPVAASRVDADALRQK